MRGCLACFPPANRSIGNKRGCVTAHRNKIKMSSDLAVFEPGAKHTFDVAAGKNIANPTAALLAAAKMLQVGYFAQLCANFTKFVQNCCQN